VNWLSLRQFRTQSLVALAALAAVAVVLAATGPELAHAYSSLVKPCAALNNCDAVKSAFLGKYALLQELSLVLEAVPGLLGVFWGAPLVARELESGTYRLAWTQSVTRTRWLVTKLAVVGLASVLVVGLLTLMVGWWSSPLDLVTAHRFGAGAFGQRGVAPMGYAAFAFALGVALGLVIRRTLPAMAATLAVFTAARVVVTLWVRPYFLPPVHLASAINPRNMGFGSSGSGPMTLQPQPPNLPNAWVYSVDLVNKAGHALGSYVTTLCPAVAAGSGGDSGTRSNGSGTAQVPQRAEDALHACVAKVAATYHQVVTYQPASRYWTFQWMETGLFVTLALLLAGGSVWWVRRRLD
jgi:hypothetical protein